jgi:hypothetical protein
MLFNVPQYIDIEDKIAGPLTARQLGWMLGMGALLLILWNILPSGIFWVLGLPVIAIFVAFAFYQPYGMSLIGFVGHMMTFLLNPKIYLWDRPGEILPPIKVKTSAVVDEAPTETVTRDRIQELSQTLDRRR